jgi:cytochrome b pre-mRNA-processing protein 3
MIFSSARIAGARPRSAGRDLYAAAVRQSRSASLYTALGAPDTVEGRFECLTLHVILLIEALRGRGGAARASSQALFDAYVSDLDGALREMGVGDLTVGKRMRALGSAFYGRAASYREALADLPDRRPLEALIARTLQAGAAGADPTDLAMYVTRCWDLLSGADTTVLLEKDAPWPEP